MVLVKDSKEYHSFIFSDVAFNLSNEKAAFGSLMLYNSILCGACALNATRLSSKEAEACAIFYVLIW